MQQSITRHDLLVATTERLSEAPVVALLGARQVGKTTLAARVASAWPGPSTVFDLEVATTREALSGTPERLLRRSEGLVVIDEVQRMPSLFEVRRPICDDRNRKAVFLLLGSASWDLIRGVSETLAGRILFRPAHHEIHARGHRRLGLSHLWVLYPGDREYPLTDAVTALPLKNVHDVELRRGHEHRTEHAFESRRRKCCSIHDVLPRASIVMHRKISHTVSRTETIVSMCRSMVKIFS